MWYSQISSYYFTRLKKFIKVNCTTRDENDLPTQFPTVLFKDLTPMEIGQDLDNTTLNAIMYSCEIRVYTNKSESKCKDLSYEVLGFMKSHRFNVNAMPLIDTKDGISVSIMRFRRVVTENDIT